LIEDLDLSLEEKFIFASSPASIKTDDNREQSIQKFAKALASKTVCRIDQHITIPVTIDKGAFQLKILEARHKIVLLYLWLSYRFSDVFSDVASANVLKNQLEVLIQEGLARICDTKDEKKRKEGEVRMVTKQIGRDRFVSKSSIEY
jgi:ATP-dependent RNA helicase SUPV3L1/SUV3